MNERKGNKRTNNADVGSAIIITANRRFDLDLRDRVRGVWDEQIGIPLIAHIVAEASGIDPQLLASEQRVAELGAALCEDVSLNVIPNKEIAHVFPGHGGITWMAVLRQSHVAIHTWPEGQYIHVDIVTCSDRVETAMLEQRLRELTNPSSVRTMRLRY